MTVSTQKTFSFRRDFFFAEGVFVDGFFTGLRVGKTEPASNIVRDFQVNTLTDLDRLIDTLVTVRNGLSEEAGVKL